MRKSVHLAIGQFRPSKGEYAANLEHLGALFAQLDALEPRPELLLLPETALTGYFLEGGVRDHALTAGALADDLQRVYRASARSGQPLDVAVGFYELFESTLFNSMLYVTLGETSPYIRHVHRKVFLPTYGLFDEERFVEHGHEVRAFDTTWGKCALLVCEDAWHGMTGALAALDGAQLVLICAAAPARGIWPHEYEAPGPASLGRWERLVRDIAEEHGVYVGLAHLVGSEGGKQFAGGSVIVGPKGEIRARGPLWEEALVTATLDLDDMARARADMPLIADLRTMLPHLVATLGRIERQEPVRLEYGVGRGTLGADLGSAAGASRQGAADASEGGRGEAGGRSGARVDVSDVARRERSAARGAPPDNDDGTAAAAERHPATANPTAIFPVVQPPYGGRSAPPPLEIDPALTERWLVNFIREEMGQRGFEHAIVGVSGGVDSAVTAYLAARALGPERVLGVRLPYRTSSRESLEHAQLVIDALGIEGRTIDISAAVDGYLANEPDADATRRGNVMARLRMIALFDLSAKHRALILGTGNKTERLLGYFTWHADDSPPVNPVGDLFKTQLRILARHLGVPAPIVEKPPSADLVVGQTDEGDFGISYEKADQILNYILAGYTDREITRAGFTEPEIATVRRRLDGTHWKRRPPTVAMVSPTAIGESYLRPVDY